MFKQKRVDCREHKEWMDKYMEGEIGRKESKHSFGKNSNEIGDFCATLPYKACKARGTFGIFEILKI